MAEETKTAEEQIEEMKAKLAALETNTETYRLENEKLRSDKGELLKETKKAKSERDALKAAQMTDEEKTKSELARLAQLEAENEALKAAKVRSDVILQHAAGLPEILRPLVTGDTVDTIKASIAELTKGFSEALKASGGNPQASAPEPPNPAGGKKPAAPLPGEIPKMSDEDFAKFDEMVQKGIIKIDLDT